ncbi:MAG: putative toxin-antitoxin system toxin component, PIN family [Cyclobacterium sp.]|uniref:putative toxin-antitoxin system toxin component, PIN family n=1 Tax=Cyclobacterium sp. TaxID=1966343 RepID=UPI00397083E0
MQNKSIKVIFDTKVWISFLIGKRLAKIRHHIADGSLIIITTEQLLIEIKTVTRREKLKKYFPKGRVEELIELLETIAEKVAIHPTHFISRDPKDNFLLDLIDYSKADFLITGDKDLLEQHPFKTAKIVTPDEFEKQLQNARAKR